MHNKFRPSSDFRPSGPDCQRTDGRGDRQGMEGGLEQAEVLRRKGGEGSWTEHGVRVGGCENVESRPTIIQSERRRKKSCARLTTVRPQDNECHSAILHRACSHTSPFPPPQPPHSSRPESYVVSVGLWGCACVYCVQRTFCRATSGDCIKSRAAANVHGFRPANAICVLLLQIRRASAGDARTLGFLPHRSVVVVGVV